MSLETIVVGDDQSGTALPGTLHQVVGDNCSGNVFPVGKIIIGAIGSNDGPISSSNPLPIKSGFFIPIYDYVGVAYPIGTQEVYTFKSGGSGGTTVATVTINYTDSTKANISDVTKT